MDESKLIFLHGRIHIHIDRAEDLPDTDTVFFNIDGKDITDPYVTGTLSTARIFKTKFVLNELNPVWDESFDVWVCHHANSVKIDVKDKEHVGATFIATCSVRCKELLSGNLIEGWFDLQNGDKDQGRLKMSLQYFPKDECETDGLEVCNSYFPVTENNRVTLYQDADTPQLPVVRI